MTKTLRIPQVTRRHDLDNLRTFLTCLVIIHHTSNCYGGPGNGPYKSELTAKSQPSSRLPLFVFNAMNQSFFMGLFFWISGRVSAESLARIDAQPARTRWSFIKSKLLRLGLPAAVYTLVLEPLTFLAVLPSWDVASVKEFVVGYFARLDRINGPVWYTANLLLFDTAVVLIPPILQALTGKSSQDQTHVQGSRTWYILGRKYGWIAMAMASFVIRVYYPIGTTVKPSALQLAFAPQYVFAYAMGFNSPNVEEILMGPLCTDSARGLKGTKDKEDNKTSVDHHQGSSSLLKAALVSLFLVPMPQIPQLFNTTKANLGALGASGIYGGWNPTSFLYAIWNEISFILIGPALMSYFYNAHNKPATSRLFQSRNSYGAYLAHMLVSTVIERGIDRVLLSEKDALMYILDSKIWKGFGPVILTVTVGTVNVIASFAVAKFILNRISFLRRII